MKKDYISIVATIISIVLFLMLLNVRSNLVEANNKIGELSNRIVGISSDLDYLQSSIRRVQDVVSQDDIIVSVDQEIKPIDVIAGTAEATVQLRVSNVHKDSTATLVLTEKERMTKSNILTYVVDKGDLEVIEEVAPMEGQILGTFEIEMDKKSDGMYSATFDTEYNREYEIYALIEYDGVVYQEQLDTIYVVDYTAVMSHMYIHFIDYNKTSEKLCLDMGVDLIGNGTDMVSVEVFLMTGETILEKINLFEESTDIDKDNDGDYGFYHFTLETPYVSGETRVILLRIEDEWGRVSETTQKIEMT